MKPNRITTSIDPVDPNNGLPDKQAVARHRGLWEREQAWSISHVDELRAFSGQWVILEGERIVCHGKDPAALIYEARRQGIKSPYIFHIGEANGDVATLGLA